MLRWKLYFCASAILLLLVSSFMPGQFYSPDGVYSLDGGVLAAEEKKSLQKPSELYSKHVLKYKPVAYWRFQGEDQSEMLKSSASRKIQPVPFEVTVVGKVQFEATGPRPSLFPLFKNTNTGIRIDQPKSFLRVKDSGEKSGLDFAAGDAMTLEAWVNPEKFPSGQTRVILAKGRTGNPGVDPYGLNYALRIQSIGPAGKVNFLFRSAADQSAADQSEGNQGKKKTDKKSTGNWHRWASSRSISFSDGWHHVVLRYHFGKKGSLVCFVDGERFRGKWDMGGDTNKAPIVNNDELWIGSSQKGRAGSTFVGAIDEVAIYRKLLNTPQILSHYKMKPTTLPEVASKNISSDNVFVEVFESIPGTRPWVYRNPKKTGQFTMPAFGFVTIPNKYSSRGIKVDRSGPYLVRATGRVVLPKGKYRLLVRSRNSARIFIDGKQVLETPFHNISGSAHGKVFEGDATLPDFIRPLHRGDQERWIEIDGDGKSHLFQYQMIVGGKNRRADFGESAAFIGTQQAGYTLLGSDGAIALTDEGWTNYALARQEEVIQQNSALRKSVDGKERQYWDHRHALAKKFIEQKPSLKIPVVSKTIPINNAIDHFIGLRLENAKQKPAPLTNDFEFLRRVTLDITGILPTEKEINDFAKDKTQQRRTHVIDRLLKSPRWADNWVGYWQDVLAENPNIIKPTLNNTGPFRWWIYESFLDNKSFDRFVTELIRMEGSTSYGGAAGFEMASGNDSPMAAKAYILGQAFLGINMKCARCHDAPFHDVTQEDLFTFAAMLNRSSLQVPKSSTISGSPDALKSLSVRVTLKPGTDIEPKWQFAEISKIKFDKGVIRREKDTREQAAVLVTSPRNERFAKVIVNRLWKRYMGYGLTSEVDDWQDAEPSHPELLEYLSREFVSHNYDLKHLARLILNSHAYQRVAIGEEMIPMGQSYLFAAPIKRRMRAEQLVDSLFQISEQSFDAGPMSVDIDSAMPAVSGFHLGEPTKAWQFVSLSNERDRPSLALPFAEPFLTTLEAFGWRGSRQEPLTDREESTTPIQPAIIANGVLLRRITGLSNRNGFTKLALKDQPVSDLVDQIVLKTMSRPASAQEKKMFIALLSEGYETRVIKNPKQIVRKRLPRNLVSWSNHFDPKANEIKVQLQKSIEKGDFPTEKLNADWRERCEDMIWVLLNTPEFIFIP